MPALFAIYPAPLIKAGAFGLLAAAAFSLGPLARARATPPASLFRRDLSARLTLCPETVAAGLSAVALAGLAVRLDMVALAPGRLPRHIPDAWAGTGGFAAGRRRGTVWRP